MREIGFVVVTHNKPAQARRLIDTLTREFPGAPIAWHHDFSRVRVSHAALPETVQLVLPHVDTAWGGFSAAEAAARGIQTLYSIPNPPDWFVLLSGADYPIKPARQIVEELLASPCNARIRHVLVGPGPVQDSRWTRMAAKRWLRAQVPVPYINHRMRLRRRTLHLPPPVSRPLIPFNDSFRCYGGEFWFSADRKAAEYIARWHRDRPDVAQYYRQRTHGSESYFQTILANAPGLKLDQNIKRYIVWTDGDPHPHTLRCADLPKMLESDAHFARKFDADIDSEVLDRLDQAIASGRM